MHLSARQGGFSLIEAVVAVAILGLACIAVSGVLTNALQAERSLERRRHLETVLAAEGERLAALPYYLSCRRRRVAGDPCLTARRGVPARLTGLQRAGGFLCGRVGRSSGGHVCERRPRR